MAGELGHVSIEPEHGPECYCGGRGCLEMLAGLEALGRRAASLPSGRRFDDERDLLDAARMNDATAMDIFKEAALQVGRVVATAATLLDPSIVVLGGEVSALGETVIEPLRTAIDRMVTPRFQRTIEVRPSRLGELAAVRGAVALVLPEVQFPTS
jgi:predicted NBD/HSP70 family sugar kinase